MNLRRIFGNSILLCALSGTALVVAVASPPTKSERTILTTRYYSLPLGFEENQGQADSGFAFLGRGSGFSVGFRKNEVDFLFAQHRMTTLRGAADGRPEPIIASSLRMKLLESNSSSRIEGAEPLPGTVNYFVGNDPAKWHTSIPTFDRVRYAQIYPGVDLEYYGTQQQLEFDFNIAPGSDPGVIRFRLDGARKLALDRHGDLIATIQDGPVTFHVPMVYQPDGKGNNLPVAGSFKISGGRTVSFVFGNYDRAKPLVIDPIVNYSTVLASTNTQNAVAMAVDNAGNVYLTGSAYYGFPITAGALQATPPTEVQNFYPFVAKLNSTGTALLYSTYLTGTSGGDFSNSIAIDASGSAYVAGFAHSTDFPVTPGAFQTSNPTANSMYGQDAGAGFVAKLNSTGTSLIYSTYLGGNTLDGIHGLAVDALGSAYVTGNTADLDFPTTAGAFQTTAGQTTTQNQSGFVTKFNPAGTALVYSTYLSGGNGDWPAAIALDTAGESYVTGWTSSPSFPTTPNAIQTALKLTSGGFVTKLKSDGSGLVYSTFLGSGSVLSAIAVDAHGNAYVGGEGGVLYYPITPGALFQPNGSFVVSKINNFGTGLIYSALFGGSNGLDSNLSAIALDSQGDAIVGGCTLASDYPVTPGAFETQNLAWLYSNESGGFVTKIDPAGATFLYSTYLGGSGDQIDLGGADCPSQIALDATGNVYVAGAAVSPDFPTTPGVVGTSSSGGVFVAEFNPSEMASLPLTTLNITSSAPSIKYGQSVTFTATVQPTSGQTPSGVVGFSLQGLQQADAGEGTGIGFGPWTWVPLDSNGIATLTMNAGMLPLPYSEIKFEAQYLGDANNAPSYATYTEPVTLIPTTITCTSSQNPAPYGAPVVFTATVLDNTGKPATGAVAISTRNMGYDISVNSLALDANGQVSWANGTGGVTLPAGTDSVQVRFSSGVGYEASSTTLLQTFTPLGTTPAPTFSPATGTYNSSQNVSLNDANATAEIYYTTDGSTPMPGDSAVFDSRISIFVNSTETIQAIAVAAGYSPSPVVSATYAIALLPPNFSLGGNRVSFAQGDISNNTSTIVVTPSNGFMGTVTLSAVITSGPPGALDPPTLSFGTTNPVSITSANPGRALLTISTTAPSRSSAQVHPSRLRWFAQGAAALAFCLGLGMSSRRRRWRSLFCALVFLVILLGGVQACGGIGGGSQSNPGTTPGNYTITVIGTSGILQQATTFTAAVDYAN